MKKRALCLLIACILMSYNMAVFAFAADAETGIFPHAIAYSGIKDIGLEKSVRAAEVVEYETGRIIVDTNINEVYNPEGKDVILMAVYTALSSLKTDSVTVAEGAVINEKTNTLGLKAGMNVAILDLTAAALLSGDVNAVNTLALAAAENTENFISRMNGVARSIGMAHSNFTNIIGRYDKNQVTTVSDMTALAVYCYNNQIITDITSSEAHYIRTDGIVERMKQIENPFELVNSSSDYFNRSIFGIGISRDSKGMTTSLVTFITSKQKYIIVLRSAGDKPYNNIVDTLDYVKKNYALVDISKIIFELGERTTIEIGGEKVYFNAMKNSATNVNVVANMFYSKSVTNLGDEYSIKPPEELPTKVKVGDVIKGFKIFYNNKQVSSINLSVKSIGEPEEEETTLGFTLYQASDVKIQQRSFMEEHSWIVIVGVVVIICAVLIIGANNLKNI